MEVIDVFATYSNVLIKDTPFEKYDFDEISYSDERKVDNILMDHNLYASVYVNKLENKLFVEINWGDWKHEHLRCKYILENNGYIQVNEQETEENGTDCYSSIHSFMKLHNN